MIRLVLPVTLFFLAVIGYFIFQYDLNINERLSADYQRQLDRNQEIINGYQVNSDVTFENLVMQNDVLNILRQSQNASQDEFNRLSNQLNILLADKYQTLKKIAKVRQLHFHSPNGQSFLRMHRPSKFGDMLFDLRYSVKKTNTELVKTQGFEEGRIFNGYRFVYPIVDNNQHLGSVEISLSMKAFTDSLSQVFEGTHCFMLDANTVGDKVFADEKSNYRPSAFGKRFVMDRQIDSELCSAGNPLIAELSDNKTLITQLSELKPYSGMIGGFLGFDGYVSHFIPVQNIENKTVAYLFNIQQNQEIATLRERFIYNLVLSIFVFIITIIAILTLNKRHEDLEEHAKTLKKTFTNLSAKYESTLAEQKYIKGLLETIFNVIDHLNRFGKVEKLLYASCENLMRYENYRFVHIYTYQGEIEVDISHIAKNEGLTAIELRGFYENIQHETTIQSVLKHGEIISIGDLQSKDYAQPIIEYLQASEINHATFLPIQTKESHTYGFMVLLTLHEQSHEERALVKKLGTTISQSIATLNRRELYESHLLEKVKNYKFILFEVVDLLEKRYVMTSGRSLRVSKYAKKIATALNLDNKNIANLVDAAILHDIGHIKIPDNIILKTEKLSPQEQKMLENHVVYGARLFERLPEFKQVHEIVLHHHEHFDGSGYPHRIKGEEIPLLSRILAVADAFEVMTTRWMYQPSMSVAIALETLSSKKGSQFDPKIVNIACHVLKDEPLNHLNRSLPTSGSELQRLQYLLMDEQTGLFDDRYLYMLAESKFQDISIEGIQIIKIANLADKTQQQHSETLGMLGKIFKKFYANDLSFFVKPDYLVLIHLESYDENLQSALLERLESDKQIHLEIESVICENNNDYAAKVRSLI